MQSVSWDPAPSDFAPLCPAPWPPFAAADDEAEPSPAPASVVIIDGQDITRAGLQNLVLECPVLRLAGAAPTLSTGLKLVARCKPDLVLTELELPDSSGLDTLKAVIDAQAPRRTLVVSAQSELVYGAHALSLGADGYILKEQPDDDILAASLAVLDGHRAISPALNAQMLQQVMHGLGHRATAAQAPLTQREIDVLQLLKTGKSSKQIAAALGISARTVDLYRAQMKKKLGFVTGAQLIAFASRHL